MRGELCRSPPDGEPPCEEECGAGGVEGGIHGGELSELWALRRQRNGPRRGRPRIASASADAAKTATTVRSRRAVPGKAPGASSPGAPPRGGHGVRDGVRAHHRREGGWSRSSGNMAPETTHSGMRKRHLHGVVALHVVHRPRHREAERREPEGGEARAATRSGQLTCAQREPRHRGEREEEARLRERHRDRAERLAQHQRGRCEPGPASTACRKPSWRSSITDTVEKMAAKSTTMSTTPGIEELEVARRRPRHAEGAREPRADDRARRSPAGRSRRRGGEGWRKKRTEVAPPEHAHGGEVVSEGAPRRRGRPGARWRSVRRPRKAVSPGPRARPARCHSRGGRSARRRSSAGLRRFPRSSVSSSPPVMARNASARVGRRRPTEENRPGGKASTRRGMSSCPRSLSTCTPWGPARALTPKRALTSAASAAGSVRLEGHDVARAPATRSSSGDRSPPPGPRRAPPGGRSASASSGRWVVSEHRERPPRRAAGGRPPTSAGRPRRRGRWSARP